MKKNLEEKTAVRRARTDWWTRRMNGLKFQVLNHYGRACECCGETCLPFLHIDHIDGSGREHRKTLEGSGTGPKLYKWLIRNGFPPGFRVLCLNCNWGARWNKGVCPHKDPTFISRRYLDPMIHVPLRKSRQALDACPNFG